MLLDYVTPRYRDFSPGEFVWRQATRLRDRGFQKVVTPPAMLAPYYDRLPQDWRPVGHAYELALQLLVTECGQLVCLSPRHDPAP